MAQIAAGEVWFVIKTSLLPLTAIFTTTIYLWRTTFQGLFHTVRPILIDLIEECDESNIWVYGPILIHLKNNQPSLLATPNTD